MEQLQKNSIVELSIGAVSHEGAGIGRWNGMAVFVPMTAAGDRVRARIVKVLKRQAYGIVEELLEPSASRVENDCPVFRQCGGCSFRHIHYEEELRLKQGFVEDNLRRIGKIGVELESILPAPSIDRYRNKAQYPVRNVDGKVCTGFFAKRSHRLVRVSDCKLQSKFFAQLCDVLCDFIEESEIDAYDEVTHTGLVRHLYLRYAEVTDELMVCIVINGKTLPGWEALLKQMEQVHPVTTLVLDHNTQRTNVITSGRQTVLFGEGTITDVLCGIKVKLSPSSFYQVNRAAAEGLYRQAADYANLSKEDVLLDLYCGAGAIGLSMAHQVQEVIGVEVVPQAVENARANAVKAGITNARFLCGDAGEAAAKLASERLQPDVVVLDPPRKGADEATLNAVAAMNPSRIVYISCNSATLARDCALLREKGYEVARARPADLFPKTPHTESVALLTRIG